MKYPKAMYIDSQIFGGDRDGSESNLTEKIVKIRTPHSCCICEKHIPKGEKMLNQKAIVEGQGWCSCYICIPCVEKLARRIRASRGWWNSLRVPKLRR